jgi:GT2 family glycosyltransferase
LNLSHRGGLTGEDVTVCLLTYNHVQLIESTLRSVMAQTLTRHEIIVSDDCSTDGTLECVAELAASDSRIRLIKTPRNLGMAGNANFAVAHSSRPYIALLHHDDIYRDDLLEKWLAVMQRHADVAYVFNAYAVDQSSRIDSKLPLDERVEGRWFLEQWLFPSWGCVVRGTAMIRRSWWEKVDGMRLEFDLLADVDLWMRLAARAAVGYVSQPLITVRHSRPDDYPQLYKGGEGFWQRQRYLYEIHAANRRTVLPLDTIRGRLRWWWFRCRLSWESTKWLGYAVIRRRYDMIATSGESVTEYDLFPLRVLRVLIRSMPSRERA